MRLLLSILITLLVPALCHAQELPHKLIGKVYVKGGGEYMYGVEFKVNGSDLSGYTVTRMPFGKDLQTDIKGTVDQKAQTLSYVELKTGAVPQIPGACYFQVQLSWKVVGNKIVFEGPCTGKDDNNADCIEGKVIFELPLGKDKLFKVKPEKTEKKPVPKPVPAPEKEIPKEAIKVTASVSHTFDWRSDSCILEIWDGQVVDGDVVTVLFNGKKILDNYSLVAAKKRIMVHLRPKNNVLSVIAENEGKAPPNTSQISLTDGNITYPVISLLKTGDTATVIIKKNK